MASHGDVFTWNTGNAGTPADPYGEWAAPAASAHESDYDDPHHPWSSATPSEQVYVWNGSGLYVDSAQWDCGGLAMPTVGGTGAATGLHFASDADQAYFLAGAEDYLSRATCPNAMFYFTMDHFVNETDHAEFFYFTNSTGADKYGFDLYVDNVGNANIYGFVYTGAAYTRADLGAISAGTRYLLHCYVTSGTAFIAYKGATWSSLGVAPNVSVIPYFSSINEADAGHYWNLQYYRVKAAVGAML